MTIEHAITLREASKADAPPVLFLHGLMGTPDSWQPIAERLSYPGRLAAEHLPGHGPEPRHHATFDSACEALATRVQSERPHVVGYSLGGRLALSLACRFPHCVRSVFAVGAHPGIDDSKERLERQNWETSLSDTLVSEGLQRLVEDWERLPMWGTQSRLSKAVLARQKDGRLSHNARSIAWAIQTLGTGSMPALWPDLETLQIPVTVVAGTEDQKLSQLNRRVLASSARVTLEQVQGVGHNVGLEAPDELSRLISLHLERSESGLQDGKARSPVQGNAPTRREL